MAAGKIEQIFKVRLQKGRNFFLYNNLPRKGLIGYSR